MDKQRYNFFLRKQNFWEYKYAIMTIFSANLHVFQILLLPLHHISK